MPDAANRLGVAIEQAVAATKIEQRDPRPPLEAGSWGLYGGVSPMVNVAVVPLDEWQRLLAAAREASHA